VHTADNLTTFTCWLSWNLGASTSWNPMGLSRPVMGLLYLFYLSYALNQIVQYNLCIKWQISSTKSHFRFHVFHWCWNILAHMSRSLYRNNWKISSLLYQELFNKYCFYLMIFHAFHFFYCQLRCLLTDWVLSYILSWYRNTSS